MALKYKMKRPEGVEALAEAGIPTATALAEKAKISRASAGRVFQEQHVTLPVAISVVHALQSAGATTSVAVMFQELEA